MLQRQRVPRGSVSTAEFLIPWPCYYLSRPFSFPQAEMECFCKYAITIARFEVENIGNSA
jgi:hypothetical protein